MTTVNVQEAKTHLSRLLQRAQAGERIIIARAGVPIAELTAVKRNEIVFGAWEGRITVDDDAFEAGDAEIAAMWDPDLGIEA